MAEIVLGIGTSHGPQLRIPPDKWRLLLEKDQKDPRYDYNEVLSRADPKMRDELSEGVFKKKYDACQDALSKLREAFSRVSPDCVVIVGDDQHEQFWEDNMPAFSVYYGDAVEQKGRNRAERMGRSVPGAPSRWWNAEAAYPREEDRTLPCDPALARHLIQEIISRGFDPAASNKLMAETGLGHAFTFVANHVMPEDGVPIVPVMVNAFFPPNRPLPARCYALGKALAQAIRSAPPDKRVAVIASGGLSHFIIDEEIDRMLLDGILSKNPEKLSGLPVERLLTLGTGEGLNWIVAAGAAEQLRPDLIDYVPCYRTPAGTGCAMAFMQWT